MTDWTLKINNFGGFKGSKVFNLKEGLNLIIGENATGKTTIINALKFLNRQEKNSENEDVKEGNHYYLHDKTQNGCIELINGHLNYFVELKTPLTILSYLKGKNEFYSKRNNRLISNNPNVIKFTFIDKSNKLMEAIEYSGSIEPIKSEIIKISHIRHHELILKKVRDLNTEFREKKEKILNDLNSRRKELELWIERNIKELEKLEEKLSRYKILDEKSEKIKNLEEKLKKKNSEYNELYYKELSKLNEVYNRISINLEKSEKKLNQLEEKKSEYESFINLENSIIKNENKIKILDQKIDNLSLKKKEIESNKKKILEFIQLLEETLVNNEDGICRHCLGNIDEKKIGKKIKELTEQKQTYLEKIKELNFQIKELNIERDKINNLLNKQKNIPKELKELSIQISSSKKRIKDYNTKLITLKDKINRVNQTLDNLKQEIDSIQKEIIQNANQDEDTKKKKMDIISKINVIKEQTQKFQEERNTLVHKILILPVNYDVLIKRTEYIIDVLNEKIEKFFLNFIDYVNSELEIMVDKLNWNFKELYIDDDLNLITINKEGKPQNFMTLSDFERKSIAIVILLIVKLKFFPDYPIFAIDEHLNSADQARFVNFINYLYENIIKSRIPLFIITSLPNNIKFEKLGFFKQNNMEDLIILYK
ncbi:MAG: AAA family ATPase [Promethearchaeia archaeon]